HLVEPPDELLGGRRVDDPPQADPAVRGRTHRAVLTGGVDGRGGAPVGFEMFGGPSCELELGMPGAVAACDAVAVLGQDLAVRIDEPRPARLVAGRARLLREFDAPPQMLQIRVVHHRCLFLPRLHSRGGGGAGWRESATVTTLEGARRSGDMTWRRTIRSGSTPTISTAWCGKPVRNCGN